jgi:hypothetical protein
LKIKESEVMRGKNLDRDIKYNDDHRSGTGLGYRQQVLNVNVSLKRTDVRLKRDE